MTTRSKILLVDDREANLVALETMLGQTDCDMLRARSGTEALELLLLHEVALALIDVQMPEMDGFELAELMRGAERTQSVPIIFVTAGVHDEAREFKGYDAGAVDFLAKPLNARILRSKVEVFLELHRHKQQLAQRVHELERAEERLRDADRRKDEFLAVLSHELRNPLMAIRGGLYVLKHVDPNKERGQRALGVLDRQTIQLTRLVDDLLDVSRIIRGKVQLQRGTVDLCEIVHRAVEDHRAQFVKAGLTLSLDCPGEPLVAHADAARIAQIVENLLANAAKFTPSGGSVSVTISRDEDRATLRVSDSGVGISEDIMPRLFQPFAQADRTLDRSRGGLGLGLSLVKSLAELHGGSAAVHSDGPGRGAEFVIVLPLSKAKLPVRSSSGHDRRTISRRRVLIVEDNVDGAELLCEAISHMGHDVKVGHDGPAALELARSFRPDVVFCDIGLPGMDGYDVARRFKSDEQLRDMRLVALTGYALDTDQKRAFEAGFSDHVAKPPSFEVLERILAQSV